jgi:hypothetical protein
MSNSTKPIVRAAIYPPIGVARIGNSREPGDAGYFIGPEVPDQPALKQGDYKDAHGALRRQAARFRIYGFDADNQVVSEITAADANTQIEWTVHLANKKAAWYNFEMALDQPSAFEAADPPATRRNVLIQDQERSKLVIDPGARSISGLAASGAKFDTGKFFTLPVDLGELRTDAQGRLLVLGGLGVSQSITNLPPQTFANNDGWHDDTSDGPVDATVTINGKAISVEGAWVVVGPPDYAPALKTVRTMYDLIYDRMVAWQMIEAPKTVSFQRHIRPIFERLSGLQWVNHGFAAYFGTGTAFDASQILIRLADGSKGNAEYRQHVYAQFRNPSSTASPLGPQLGKELWPPFYGDSLDSLSTPSAQTPDPSLTVPQGLASLSALQLSWLQKWAAGQFVSDLSSTPPTSLEQVALAEQPHALTEAALDHCLADAFHPGCELTWPMRIQSLYSGPFRIRRRTADLPELDCGEVLTPAKALSAIGPLSASGPGDLSRWMAVPWQTDTASCLSGYPFFRTSASLPTFWPARVPNQVLSAHDYDTVMDAQAKPEERRAAFYRRHNWFRVFKPKEHSQIEVMIKNFDKLGIIEERSGPKDLEGVPAKVWVESKPGHIPPDPNAPQQARSLRATAASQTEHDDGGNPEIFEHLRQFGKHRRP